MTEHTGFSRGDSDVRLTACEAAVTAPSRAPTKAFWYFWLRVGHVLLTCSRFQLPLELKYHFNNRCLLFLAMGKLIGLFLVVNKGVNMVRLDLFLKEYSALDLVVKL